MSRDIKEKTYCKFQYEHFKYIWTGSFTLKVRSISLMVTFLNQLIRQICTTLKIIITYISTLLYIIDI